MTETRRPAADGRPAPIVVRPRPVVVIASLLAALGMVGWTAHEASTRPAVGSVAAAILFTAITAWVAAALVLQRVELDGETVRIVRVVTTDVADCADVLAAHQSGGRGRPPFIRLRDGVASNAPSVNATRWPPRARRTSGATPTPSFLTSRQIASALDVPLRSWSGGEPSRWADDDFGKLWRDGPTVRRVLLVLLAATIVLAPVVGLLTNL